MKQLRAVYSHSHSGLHCDDIRSSSAGGSAGRRATRPCLTPLARRRRGPLHVPRRWLGQTRRMMLHSGRGMSVHDVLCTSIPMTCCILQGCTDQSASGSTVSWSSYDCSGARTRAHPCENISLPPSFRGAEPAMAWAVGLMSTLGLCRRSGSNSVLAKRYADPGLLSGGSASLSASLGVPSKPPLPPSALKVCNVAGGLSILIFGRVARPWAEFWLRACVPQEQVAGGLRWPQQLPAT